MAGFGFFFILLFLSIWAGSLWVQSAEWATWSGVPWLSFIVIGVIVMLFLAAFVPRHVPPTMTDDAAAEEAVETVGLTVGLLFWLLLLGLIFLIVAAYAF
jgi:hypothetical protein